MMTLVPLLLAALVQQPQNPARTNPAARSPAMLMPQGDTIPRTAYDSTLAVVSEIARAVANVRAETDRFRTRAFNDAIGSVLESATAFESACTTMAGTATRGRPLICRTCMRPEVRPAFERYRAYLPSLTTLGTRCVARLRARVTSSSAPATLRSTALEMSNMMVAELRRYEQRVGEVRAALSAPRRAAR